MGQWIDTGTVTVATGSVAVTGSGTAWNAQQVIPGYAFMGPDGRLYEIEQLVSPTAINLTKPYAGSNGSGQAYQIIQIPFASNANILEKLQTLIATWQTTANLTGTLKVGAPAEDGAVLATKGPLASFENAGSVAVKVGKAATSDTAFVRFHTGSVIKAEIGTNSSDELVVDVGDGGTVNVLTVGPNGHIMVKRGVNLNSGSGAPSGIANGSIWYDTALNKLRCHQNGVTTDVVGLTGGSVTSSTWATITGAIADNATLAAALAGKQPLSATLTTLSSATAAGLALMDDADAAAQRTTLGLGPTATTSFTLAQLNTAINDADVASIATLNSDYAKGFAALDLVPVRLRGEKFTVIDLIGNGVASVGPVGGWVMAQIESFPNATVTNSTGGKRLSRKMFFENVSANALRLTHGLDGTPLGALFEPGHAYLNKRTQPLVSQCDVFAAVTDGSPPTGYTGNAIVFGDNSAFRQAGYSIPVVSGVDVYFSVLVAMDDGLAPSPGAFNVGTADFRLNAPTGALPLNPSTGSAGYRVTGPLAGNVYRVDAYYVPTATGTWTAVIAKSQTTQSAKPFKVLFMQMGQGRYPPSLFDNTTATPNSRAEDRLYIPVSGFTTHGITICGEITVPEYFDATTRPWFGLFESVDPAKYVRGYFYNSNVPKISMRNGSSSADVEIALGATLTSGQTYKFAIAIDRVGDAVRSKFKSIGAFSQSTIAENDTAPDTLAIGADQSPTNIFNSTIQSLHIIDRPWTAAEISSFTG